MRASLAPVRFGGGVRADDTTGDGEALDDGEVLASLLSNLPALEKLDIIGDRVVFPSPAGVVGRREFCSSSQGRRR